LLGGLSIVHRVYNSRPHIQTWLLLGLFIAPSGFTAAAPPTATKPIKSQAWSPPPAEAIIARLENYLTNSDETGTPLSDAQRDALLSAAQPALITISTEGDRLKAVVDCLALRSDVIADLKESCDLGTPPVDGLPWLDSADLSNFVRTNVRTYAGRALVRHGHYDDSLLLLSNASLEECVDPAALLFYRAIAEHQLVRVSEATQSLTSLLSNDEELPERFAKLAEIMQADVAAVEDDSLDHIARRMADVRRRLGLGQADERAQLVEREILASLDKVIEKAEQQQREQQQKQQQQSSGGNQPSGQPMEDSQIAERKGEGKVDIKDIGDTDGWGELPPRERERVLQQIGRDFPGHYRDLMEQYLKRLATDQHSEDRANDDQPSAPPASGQQP